MAILVIGDKMTLREFLTSELEAGRMVRGVDIDSPNDGDPRTGTAYYNPKTRKGCIMGLASQYLDMRPNHIEMLFPRDRPGMSHAIEHNDAGEFSEAIDLVCEAFPAS